MAMSRFREKLRLQPPAHCIVQRRSSSRFVRFQDPKYVTTEADVWKEFGDAEWKWNSPGRYGGSGLNCGYYYSSGKDTAVAEMNLYNKTAEWRNQKAQMTISCQFDGVIDLTERDSIEFVIDDLLEFPYGRLTFRLALLASLTARGNLLTDYIGCWAYHKGFQGVMFLSARALDPYRAGFDSSAIPDESFWMHWTSWAHNFDYLEYKDLLEIVRERPQNYLNVVFFNGPVLLSKIESYSIVHPTGHKLEGANPHFKKQPDFLRNELGFEDSQHRRDLSFERMEKLQARVDAACEDVNQIIEMHEARKILNQQFGAWIEEKLLHPDGILQRTKETV